MSKRAANKRETLRKAQIPETWSASYVNGAIIISIKSQGGPPLLHYFEDEWSERWMPKDIINLCWDRKLSLCPPEP
jgi:hypothetical protein